MKNFGLRFQTAIVGVVIFLLMSSITFIFIRYFSIDIARDLGSEYARENAMRYAEKIKGTIDLDLILTQKLSTSPDVAEWAKNENDPLLKQKVFSLLNDYLDISKAGSWFIAFDKSGHYYFNDSNGSYTGSEYIKILSPTNLNDKWFYNTLNSPDPYNLNIDFDEALGLTKLWINVPIILNGKHIGVVGVGFDYTHFINEYIAEDKKGFTTMILNNKGAIVAHKNKRYVNYHSKVMNSTEWITLSSLVDKGHNEALLPKYIADLVTGKVPTTSFDLYMNGHHYIASATYLPDLKWINLSMVDLDNVFGMNEMAIIVIIFVLLTLFAGVIVYFISERYFISPIRAMSDMTHRIKNGDFSSSPKCDMKRSDEIGQLCRDVNEMALKIGESTKHAEEKYRWLADNTSDVIWVMELDGSFDYISPSVERLRGYSVEEVMNQKLEEAVSPESFARVQQAMAEALLEVSAGKIPTVKSLRIEQPHKNGSTVWTEVNALLVLNEQEKPFRFIGTTRDISDRLKAEAEIEKLAFYDPLTSLANRRLLLDRLEQAILFAKRTGLFSGLIYLDLDKFKPLNDQFGHEAGDELLIEVGRRIKECVRATDTASRFGGDEFIILINDVGADLENGVQYTETIAKKIESEISRPYTLRATSYTISASVGVNVFGKEVSTTNEVISYVDQLMYKDKEAKKDQKKEEWNI
jgi:diguanylate cyclase (GGDEF)-like protein/PAS domain S-box-containing protein